MKWYWWIPLGLLLVVLIPIIVFGFIMFFVMVVVPAPIEYIFYRRSHYYKKLNIKYHMGVWYREDYRMYNAFVKRNIAFSYHPLNDEHEPVFIIGNVMFFIYAYENIFFDEEENEWMLDGEQEELITLTDYILKETRFLESEEAYDIKVLIWQKDFAKKDLKKAQEEPRFLIYKKEKSKIDAILNVCQAGGYDEA